MSASIPSAASLPSLLVAKANHKPAKQSKRIILHIHPSLLAHFPTAQPVRKASRSKQPAITTPQNPVSKDPQPSPPEAKPEHEAIPIAEFEVDPTPQDPASNGQKRKGVPGPKPGAVKRPVPGLDANGIPKPRGKPGPKKRLRIEGDMVASTGGPTPVSHHKLGPKFHQGAINAGLRALDRTGRPCRRWQQTGFQLKSFTGVAWELPSWRTPKLKDLSFDDHVKSETTGSSDAKPEHPSSDPNSDKSTNGADNTMVSGLANTIDSPVPDALPEIRLSA